MELRHVGIYNQDNETGVEELSYEGSLNDWTLLLGHGILTDPSDKQHNDLLKHNIDTNNNSGNG